MFLTILVYIFAFFVKLFIYTLFVFVALVIGLKLWLEPIKGICKCQSKLYGKVALITGGNSGIGLETARDLARRGARVIIASRDDKKSEAAVADIVATTGNSKVEWKHLDLSKLDDVRRFAKDFIDNEQRLDILVNNAGCAGLKKRLTDDGIDLVMQINHLGPFLLTNLLLDKLKSSKPSRIVIVSSHAYTFAKFDPDDLIGVKTEGYWTRYCNSKLCNILWARALAKRLPDHVIVNSLHPGVVKTDIFKRLPSFYRSLTLKVISLVFKTAREGAQTTIHLCVAQELANATGGYYRDCKPEQLAGIVTEDLAERVWENSLKLTEN